MIPEQQELFDLAILRVLDANRTRFGLGQQAIGHLLLQFGFAKPDQVILADRIGYLTDKGMIEEVLKELNKANRAWRISTAGIDYIDNHA